MDGLEKCFRCGTYVYFEDRECPTCARDNENAALRAQLAERDTPKMLAREQPCGCVPCYCAENEEHQCLGCGAKRCDKHVAIGSLLTDPEAVWVSDPSARGIIAGLKEQLAERERESMVRTGEYATVIGDLQGRIAALEGALRKLLTLRFEWRPDWTCSECVPQSHMLVGGFLCKYHGALALLARKEG